MSVTSFFQESSSSRTRDTSFETAIVEKIIVESTRMKILLIVHFRKVTGNRAMHSCWFPWTSEQRCSRVDMAETKRERDETSCDEINRLVGLGPRAWTLVALGADESWQQWKKMELQNECCHASLGGIPNLLFWLRRGGAPKSNPRHVPNFDNNKRVE